MKTKAFLIGGGLSLFIGLMLFLFLDGFFGSNFRTTQDTIWSTEQVDLRGLRELRASGGTLVRFSDLRRKLSTVKGPKIIVDSMSEFHGYINGIPTTFLAYQKPPKLKHLIRRLILTGTTEMTRDRAVPESEEAKKYGFDYIKVNVGSNFITPDEDIDKITSFFDTIPSNAWVHLHCSHGKGRTSILLAMLDIFRNAPMVSLQDIVKRQYLLGSEDLFDTEVWKDGTYDKEQLEARKKFVEDFYAFVCQRKAGGIQRWSDWKLHSKVSDLTLQLKTFK